jgi:hypothetical protein
MYVKRSLDIVSYELKMDARGMELRESWLRDKKGLLRVERSSEMAGWLRYENILLRMIRCN